MEILTAPFQIGTHSRGFSAQFPTKKGPGNLTPNLTVFENSRLSFPATGPPDPGRVSEGFQKGSPKGSLKVFEGLQKGFRRGPRQTPYKTLQKPFKNPSETPSETRSETLPGSGGPVARNESLEFSTVFASFARVCTFGLSVSDRFWLSVLALFHTIRLLPFSSCHLDSPQTSLRFRRNLEDGLEERAIYANPS